MEFSAEGEVTDRDDPGVVFDGLDVCDVAEFGDVSGWWWVGGGLRRGRGGRGGRWGELEVGDWWVCCVVEVAEDDCALCYCGFSDDASVSAAADDDDGESCEFPCCW